MNADYFEAFRLASKPIIDSLEREIRHVNSLADRIANLPVTDGIKAEILFALAQTSVGVREARDQMTDVRGIVRHQQNLAKRSDA